MIGRVAPVVALGVAILGLIVMFGATASVTVHPDADAYWLAAQRLREGAPLYGGPRGDETQIYRYAPWFAFAWVPLTYFGKETAFLLWRLTLVVSIVVAVWPLLQRPSRASITLAVLLGGLLLSNLPAANATPLIVAMLVAGFRTNVGPVLLGLAGSLKLFPLVLVAGYLAERRWLAAAVSIGVASMLWLNILAFDVLVYTQIGGPSFYVGGVSLFGVSPLIWVAVSGAIGLIVVRLVVVRSPWAWLAVSASIPAAVPRVWLPDVAYILVGAAETLRGVKRDPAQTVEPDAQPGQDGR